MDKQSIVKVTDPDSGGEAFVLIRRTSDAVALAVAIEGGGDLEVFLPPDAALQVAAALTEAARALQSNSPA